MKNFLRGLLAGAAIAYLTAPRSGKKTRERISDKINGYKGDFEDARNKMAELVDEVKSQTGLGTQAGVVGKVESKIDQYKHKAYEAKEDAKNSYNQEVGNVADKAKSGIDTVEEKLKV
jgi:gas vesicle protein